MDITDYFANLGASDPSATGYGAPLLLPQVSAAYRADPRRALIESMMATGQQSLSTPTLSPGAALAKALTIGLGGIASAKLTSDYQDQNAAAQKNLADALAAPDMAGMISKLGSNPVTAPQALQLQQQQMLQQRKFRMEADQKAADQGLANVWDPTGTTILAQHKIQGADTARGDIAQGTEAGKTKGQLGAEIELKPTLDAAETPALAARAAAAAAAENPALIARAAGTAAAEAPIKVDTANKIEQGKVVPAAQMAAAKAEAEAKYKTATVGPGAKVVLEHPELNGAPPATAEKTQAPVAPPATPPGASPASPSASAAPPAATPPPATPAAPSVIAQSDYPPADILGPRQKKYETIMQQANDATDEAHKAALLKQQLHDLGMNGPAVPFLAHLSRYASNIGVPDETIAKYGLPNGATEEQAQKLSTDLLGEVLKAQFPSRITNNDIKLFQNTVPGPGMMGKSNDFLFDNIIGPRVQRDVARAGAIVDLPKTDPGLNGLERAIYDFNTKHPLTSYTPALQPKPEAPAPAPVANTAPSRADIEAEMRKRGLLK